MACIKLGEGGRLVVEVFGGGEGGGRERMSDLERNISERVS